MHCTMDSRGLSRRMETSSDLIVLDVLLPELYQVCHIPGAVNACVYEVAFLDTIHRLIPDKDAALVVYGGCRHSRAAASAAEKLARDGYTNVCELSDGLEGWLASAHPTEPKGARPPEEPVLAERRYRIEPGRSQLTWIGRNLGGRHVGNLAISSGEITIANGELSGRIAVDMKSVSNLDLQDPGYRDLLLAHLVSEDFFDAARHPSAEAEITGWRPIPGASPGRPNYEIDAELTVKGITHPVRFPASVAPQEDGSIKAQASLEIDRTAWNITYGSGKLYEKLGMHLVHDTVTLELFLVAV